MYYFAPESIQNDFLRISAVYWLCAFFIFVRSFGVAVHVEVQYFFRINREASLIRSHEECLKGTTKENREIKQGDST